MNILLGLKSNKLFVFASIILFLSITLFFACKRTSLDNFSNEAFDVNAAKEWYYGTFKKSNEYSTYNSKIKGSKNPNWNNSKYAKFGNIEVIEIPLSLERKLIPLPNIFAQSNTDKRRLAQATSHNQQFVNHSFAKQTNINT